MISNSTINKDLILREQLALQRTVLANQTTLLSFLKSSMYFLIVGLSIKNVLMIENRLITQIFLFSSAFVLFILWNYKLFHPITIRKFTL